MVLSHSKKFIFIHIYKVAGTSISKELAKYAGLALHTWRPYRFISERFPQIFPNKYPRHAYARHVKKVLKPELYNSYFKFAFVRNPWDWHVSQYHYILRKKTHHQHQLVSGFGGFEGYVEWLVTTKVTTQKSMISDEQGNLIVDFVGKIENLDADFKYICKKIGIPQIDLPHLNQTKKEGYRKYYNERTADLIRQAYKDDVETFNYEF